MSSGFLAAAIRKDLLRLARDPAAILLWIGIPLIIGVLISLAFGGREGPRPKAEILVVDQDDSLLSSFLMGALSQPGADLPLVAREVPGEEEGRDELVKAKAAALLIIPEGFADRVLRSEEVALRLLKNPSQTVLPGIAEEFLRVVVDGTFYLQTLFGDDLRAFADLSTDDSAGFDLQRTTDLTVRIQEIATEISNYLTPALIEIEFVIPEEESDSMSRTDLGLLFLPGLLFMSLLFASQGLSQDVWKERLLATLRRTVVSPQSSFVFLVGKLVSGTIVFALVAVVALLAGYTYLEIDLNTLPLGAIWATASGAMLLAGMTTIQLFAQSQRAGTVLTMFVVFPLMMLGGSFFPIEAMPENLAALSRWTPNGWALDYLKGIVFARVSWGEMVVPFVILVLSTGLVSFLGAWRLRTHFARGA